MLLLILALRVALYVAPLLSLTLQLRVIEGLAAPIGVDLLDARRKFFAGGVALLDTGIFSQAFEQSDVLHDLLHLDSSLKFGPLLDVPLCQLLKLSSGEIS